MTKTIAQLKEEYLNRQKNAEYEKLVISADGTTCTFKNVSNLKNVTNYKFTGPDTYEFDYAEPEVFGAFSYHHVSITGKIIMKSNKLED